MKMLITGFAGFIGFHAAREFLRRGWEVVGIDNFCAYYDVKLKRDRAARQEYLNGLRHRRVPGDLRIDRIIDEGIGPDDERLR